jgi:hypothetical protein
MDTFTGSPGAGVSVGPGIGVISEALVGDQIQSRERKEHEIQLQILQQQLEIRRQQLEMRRQQIEIESLRKSLQGFY